MLNPAVESMRTGRLYRPRFSPFRSTNAGTRSAERRVITPAGPRALTATAGGLTAARRPLHRGRVDVHDHNGIRGDLQTHGRLGHSDSNRVAHPAHRPAEVDGFCGRLGELADDTLRSDDFDGCGRSRHAATHVPFSGLAVDGGHNRDGLGGGCLEHQRNNGRDDAEGAHANRGRHVIGEQVEHPPARPGRRELDGDNQLGSTQLPQRG
jgi:hypothetical protein